MAGSINIRGMTSHQIARLLLERPDVQVRLDGASPDDDDEPRIWFLFVDPAKKFVSFDVEWPIKGIEVKGLDERNG